MSVPGVVTRPVSGCSAPEERLQRRGALGAAVCCTEQSFASVGGGSCPSSRAGTQQHHLGGGWRARSLRRVPAYLGCSEPGRTWSAAALAVAPLLQRGQLSAAGSVSFQPSHRPSALGGARGEGWEIAFSECWGGPSEMPCFGQSCSFGVLSQNRSWREFMFYWDTTKTVPLRLNQVL